MVFRSYAVVLPMAEQTICQECEIAVATHMSDSNGCFRYCGDCAISLPRYEYDIATLQDTYERIRLERVLRHGMR